jgi:hypothetical protein
MCVNDDRLTGSEPLHIVPPPDHDEPGRKNISSAHTSAPVWTSTDVPLLYVISLYVWAFDINVKSARRIKNNIIIVLMALFV